jgi:two-component system sensor histidine kinase SenX3
MGEHSTGAPSPGRRLRSIDTVSPTTQALLAALAGAIVAGGAVLAWKLSEEDRRPPPESRERPQLPAGIATVLSVLRSSAVVVDDQDLVVKASAPALALGLVRGDRLVPEDLATVVSQVRRDGQIREIEFAIERRTGRPRTVTGRVAPLSSRLVLALVEDRTEERRVEEVRRDFVANVSHELKTPVGAIRLLAEAVSDASDDPEAVERFAGRMLTESDRLSRLVQQVIELSRLQGDEPLEAPVVVPVDKVVARSVESTEMDATSRNISVVPGGTPGLHVFGNAELISAAVTNLVANAVTYSEPGSTVVVSTKAEKDMVQISVVDRGIGIPPGELDRIFERFYRVDPARHRSTGGTGVGLSIVKHVAAIHGGDVRVWSVEGQGSTFTVSLPRSRQEEDA